VIDDVHAFQVFIQTPEVIAVDLVELDSRRHVVQVAANHVVAPHDAMTVSEKGIGEMAPQETGYT
jgi:hypothetical protein